jgi:hypothetical protein
MQSWSSVDFGRGWWKHVGREIRVKNMLLDETHAREEHGNRFFTHILWTHALLDVLTNERASLPLFPASGFPVIHWAVGAVVPAAPALCGHKPSTDRVNDS